MSFHNLARESAMNVLHLSAALMASGRLMAALALAQTSPAQRPPTQSEGGGTALCGLAFNANPGGDPNCKQRTQNLVPSPARAAAESVGRKQGNSAIHPVTGASRDPGQHGGNRKRRDHYRVLANISGLKGLFPV
jgi:hypothetical protein